MDSSAFQLKRMKTTENYCFSLPLLTLTKICRLSLLLINQKLDVLRDNNQNVKRLKKRTNINWTSC